MHVISQHWSLYHFQHRPADVAPFTSLDFPIFEASRGLGRARLPLLKRIFLLSQGSPAFLQLVILCQAQFGTDGGVPGQSICGRMLTLKVGRRKD